jgi:hypothetical protein
VASYFGKDFPNFGCVFAKNRRDQFFAFWGERNNPDAPILRTLDPAYQASIQQAVDGHTDRAGRKVNTFGPIVFTGKGPLLRSASSIRKSLSSIPVSSSPA